MEVRRAEPLGKDVKGAGGFEFICRTRPWGSFLRRYRNYISDAERGLDYLVEITIKDDERGDPLINDDAILALGLLSAEHLAQAKQLTRQVCRIVEAALRGRGLVLIDMKIEIGLVDGQVVVIDEVSADAMRVMDQAGKLLDHAVLCQQLIGENSPHGCPAGLRWSRPGIVSKARLRGLCHLRRVGYVWPTGEPHGATAFQCSSHR